MEYWYSIIWSACKHTGCFVRWDCVAEPAEVMLPIQYSLQSHGSMQISRSSPEYPWEAEVEEAKSNLVEDCEPRPKGGRT